jgi:hypothetical protein
MTNTQYPISSYSPQSEAEWDIHLDDVAQGLRALETHLVAIQEQVADLEQAGVTEASPYWRKDKEGNPRILYLIHPSQDGQRKREYVGVDPAKQVDALARVQRWEQRQRLIKQANQLTSRLSQIYADVHAIHVAVTELGEQCRTKELARCQDL